MPPPGYRHIHNLAPKLPDGVSDWKYFDPIGIRHFDENGCCPFDENGHCPSGRDVQLRRLDQYNSYGRYYAIIVDDEGGSGERSEEKLSICRSSKTAIDCNFFVGRGCLAYLRVWLDPCLPQRVAFMDSAPSMNLEGELYEINSRHEITGTNMCSFIHTIVISSLEKSSLFPSFQYGDIPKTLEQDQHRFLKVRQGSHNTSRAINAGLRGKELLPALFIWRFPMLVVNAPRYVILLVLVLVILSYQTPAGLLRPPHPHLHSCDFTLPV